MGGVSLHEFLSQFDFSNGWGNSVKPVALASSLGKARAILNEIAEIKSITFSKLRTKLEIRFSKEHSAQSFYLQYINRKQKFNEKLTFLKTDIEHLAYLAYREYFFEVQDKITCAQFIVVVFYKTL